MATIASSPAWAGVTRGTCQLAGVAIAQYDDVSNGKAADACLARCAALAPVGYAPQTCVLRVYADGSPGPAGGERAWNANEKEKGQDTSHLPAAPAVEMKSSPGEAAAPKAPADGFSFSAYFDVYYNRNFNNPPLAAAPASGTAPLPSGANNLRLFDVYPNQLGLNLMEFTVKHVRKETSFFVDFDFGHLADLSATTLSLAGSGGPGFSLVDEVSKHIGQAVLTYTPAALPNFVVEGGKLATHVGLELAKPKDNWNYSRSTLFSFGIPLWHTGLHVGYGIIPEHLTAGVYVYQGWNTLYENNAAPTWGGQLKWAPTEKTTLVYNYIGGPEQPGNNDNWKQVHEVNLTQALGEKWAVAGDVMTGREANPLGTGLEKATWSAFEALVHFQPSHFYSLSPRFEIYHDPQGFTLGGGAQTMYGYTLTNSFQPAEGLELRVEARWDHSTAEDRFVTRDGVSAGQATLGIGVLYTM